MLTQEQTKKIQSAIRETARLIAKENKYSPELRNEEYLKFLKEHSYKLEEMIYGETA